MELPGFLHGPVRPRASRPMPARQFRLCSIGPLLARRRRPGQAMVKPWFEKTQRPDASRSPEALQGPL